jgi:hypothetical protein
MARKKKVVNRKVSKPKPKPELKKTIVGYAATYTGNQGNIRISGVGRIHIGSEFPVTKEIYNTLKHDENFKVEIKYKYGD